MSALGPYNGYHEFREYPKALYNSAGELRRVEDAEQEAALGEAWQCRPDGSSKLPMEEAAGDVDTGKAAPNEAASKKPARKKKA